jgi:serine/threonine-protein kinase haspin
MELPQSPIRRPPPTEQFTIDEDDDSIIQQLEKQLELIEIGDESGSTTGSSAPEQHADDDSKDEPEIVILADDVDEIALHDAHQAPAPISKRTSIIESVKEPAPAAAPEPTSDEGLRVLTWHDVCPQGDTITKIAEASYAEVYRVRNARGTSIIKCIRLPSPLKPQTKAQMRSGLVDEEPHAQTDLQGELRISEWLADIPGFVIYKERYIVEGRAPKSLLETHQAFQKKMRRQDPDRLQFYPSPSRYLDGTRFLVVELGDAGVALEDFELTTAEQLWDIFFLVAVALARAEDLIAFEVSPPLRVHSTPTDQPSTVTSTKETSASAKSTNLAKETPPVQARPSATQVSTSPSSTMASPAPRSP